MGGASSVSMLWTAGHKTLKDTEVPLLEAAGFDVITSPIEHWSVFAKNYSDYDSYLPQPAADSKIPEKIRERIRAINIVGDFNSQSSGQIADEDAKLINQYIDVIYVMAYPQTVLGVLSWFNGVVLFRYFGNPEVEWSRSAVCERTGIKDVHFLRGKMRHLWCPAYSSLSEIESSVVSNGANRFLIHVTMEPKRLEAWKWSFSGSAREVVTVLSYLDVAPVWKSHYDSFVLDAGDTPYRILGKNPSGLFGNPNIHGHVDNDDQFYEILSKARIFVDPGTSRYHMHYTPLEAIVMGIPFFYLRDSGFSAEVRATLGENLDLEEYGECQDWSSLWKRVSDVLDSQAALEEMAERQARLFELVFSKERVLEECRRLYRAVPDLKKELRNSAGTRLKSYLVLKRMTAAPVCMGYLARVNSFVVRVVKYIRKVQDKGVRNIRAHLSQK